MREESALEILVCPNCGKNGEEATIEERGTYVDIIDKYGDSKWSDMEPKDYHCTNCDEDFEQLITIIEWKALQREEQIKSILE